jgi:hypothetical protein
MLSKVGAVGENEVTDRFLISIYAALCCQLGMHLCQTKGENQRRLDHCEHTDI